MTPTEQLNTLLASIGQTIGLPDLQADSEGFCSLGLDQVKIHLQAEEDTGDVLLFTELGMVPLEARGRIFEEMLESNAFFSGTEGATLGLLPGGEGRAFLCQRAPLQLLDGPGFQLLLENFTNVAESWSIRLTEAIAPQAGGDTSSSGSLSAVAGLIV